MANEDETFLKLKRKPLAEVDRDWVDEYVSWIKGVKAKWRGGTGDPFGDYLIRNGYTRNEWEVWNDNRLLSYYEQEKLND